ncbi:MAG: hypothetical protein ACC662_04695 [Planctomycetota bacterium]
MRASGRRAAVGWLLRLLGLGLIAWVLATQLEVQDLLVLKDGRVLEGAVSREADGSWRVLRSGGGGDAGPGGLPRSAGASAITPPPWPSSSSCSSGPGS